MSYKINSLTNISSKMSVGNATIDASAVTNSSDILLPNVTNDTLASLAATQTLTNKSLVQGNTSVSSSTCCLVDESDNTKKVYFNISGFTTGTTTGVILPSVIASGASGSNKVAIISYQLSTGTNGGQNTSTRSWLSRNMNTLVGNCTTVALVNGSSGVYTQFTLQAGYYYMEAMIMAYNTGSTLCRLQNITSSSTVATSLSYILNGESAGMSLVAYITPTATTTYSIQMNGSNSSGTTDYGYAAGVSGSNETYLYAIFFQL